MTFLNQAKTVANRMLASRDQIVTHTHFVPSPKRFIATMKAFDQDPVTVFDIGVAEGTPWLYDSFPKAKFHLIDPTRESVPHMQRWKKTIDADIHEVALGAEEGTMRIYMRDTIKHASLMKDVTAPEILDSYEVPVERFDARFGDFARPAFCKIDVEGAEMLVLEGMNNRLTNFAAIVVETSMNSLYENGPEFGDVMALMVQNGMRFYDFIGLSRRPSDLALHQIDAVFVPQNSPLRVKAWDSGMRA